MENEKIINRLSEFISRHNYFELLKGLITTAIIVVFLLTILVIIEYFASLNSLVRGILFYGFLLFLTVILYQNIIKPFFILIKLRKGMTYEQAAIVIGEHFGEVKDKLLNALQLQSAGFSSSLAEAMIQQRSQEFEAISFTQAVDKERLKKQIPYFILVIVFSMLVYVINPNVFKLGAKRIIEYNVPYHLTAPFEVDFSNSFEVFSGEDIELVYTLRGNSIPTKTAIVFDNSERNAFYENEEFTYTFHNLNEDQTFFIKAGKYTLGPFKIKVFEKPVLQFAKMKIHYPAYLNKQEEQVSLSKRIDLPEGSKIEWSLRAMEGNMLQLLINDSIFQDEFALSHQMQIHSDLMYSVFLSNKYRKDSIINNFEIRVVSDAYPQIRVEEFEDEMLFGKKMIKGFIKDDYGFHKLYFVYQIDENEFKKKEIPISKNTIEQGFEYFFDEQTLLEETGRKTLAYFFEIKDNDALNGFKSTRSPQKQLQKPGVNESGQAREEARKALKESQKNIEELAKQLDLAKAKQNLQEQKELDWKDQKKLSEISKGFQDLQKRIEQTKSQYEKKRQSEQTKDLPPHLQDKMEMMDELFNNLLDEKTQKALEDLQKRLDDSNKEDAIKALEELDITKEKLLKDLERNLELFKRLDFEIGFEKALEEIKELKKEQEELIKEDFGSKEQEKQNDLLNKMKEVAEELKRLQKENQELDEPFDVDFGEKESKEAQDMMQQASDKLEKNKNAGKEQQEAKDALDKLDDKLSQSMQDSQESDNAEDLDKMRQLQENLIALSFMQEDVYRATTQFRTNEPGFRNAGRSQRQIKEDFKMVRDSLDALSKRVLQLAFYIGKELDLLDASLARSMFAFAEGEGRTANQNSREAMTNYNNLALLFSEVMDQMQQQQKSKSKPGQGSCTKPGSGNPKPSMSESRKKLESINRKMKELNEKMKQEQGEKQGGSKPGDKPGEQKSGKPGQGEGGSAGDIAKMAAEQQALREAMRRLSEEAMKNGQGELAKELKEMEKQLEDNESQLLKKQISQELIRRQEQILSKMLESEKSWREQEQDQKRESNSGDKKQLSSEDAWKNYFEKRRKEIEQMQYRTLDLQHYYQIKVGSYQNLGVE